MLIKLLKYEFRAAFRELITLYIALLGIASLLRPFYLYNLSGSLTGITVFVYAALIVAVMVMSCITIIQRFSKTMLGPEGYLMHTLPVSATVHIFSKLITAMVIVVAGFLVGTISMLIIAADSSFFLLLRSFWEEFIRFLYDLFGQNGLIVGLELILLSLSQSACGILMVYTAACIGHLFYLGRAVIAVFSYVVMTAVLGEVTAFVNALLRTAIATAQTAFLPGLGTATYSGDELLPQLLTSLLLCVGLFYAVRYILENRLNLE